ncbi:LOW QUALITY PROTEIN: homologous recombination OB-fold protein [Hippoglossus stenolepis]|uniref:LOW QUALITY PROTEIN: homologous recombination OB-fold protein n=1 Tax=Hippoglossus stenolepis TaxID=195615 RepID=UPI001FB01D5B|nr:LOW QUALITY PROTEIN: homologous recombination OB-fold protein [Hippoglossus stenolepis]
MTCKLNGLFSIGEDFDDEDLLETDWSVRSASGASDVAAVVSSCSLRAPTAAHTEPERKPLQRSAQRSTAPFNGTASAAAAAPTDAAAGQTVVVGLRQLPPSSSSTLHSLRPPTQNNTILAQHPKPCAAQDDFDDWDVDLADLDECDGQMGQPPPPPAPSPSAPTAEPASSAKTLRAPTCGGIQTLPDRTLSEVNAARQPCSSSNHNLPSRTLSSTPVRSPLPRPAFLPPQSPGVFPGLTATSPAPSPISRTLIRPQPPQRLWSTPGPSPQARGFFETVSPAPSSSSSMNSTMLSPHPLHAPLLTNRLVQLVSASNRLTKKRPHSEPHRTRTRRFPGPAGFLPQQPQGQSLDDVVVSVPHTPAHGAVARSPNQVSSSQTEEDEFSGGAWAAMKAEMGLDERNPSCFLQTYSVVMVLRKAALKQLAKNKVPNMAVLLKSIIHTHTDAKAVFKDPTGEIQGTVHRRLLEERAEELKVGAVLLLKQVGVFSPSHRNHYLNVTQNNLLRIYTSDGVSLSSTQLPPLVLEPMLQSTAQPPTIRREPVSQMHLVFDEEEDEGQEGGRCTEGGKDPQAPTDGRPRSSGGPQQPAGNPAPQDPDWDADDDLDELLGELPEDTYSL